MSFAAPLAFALAALAVPILVLYILKVRMRRLPVSTNLFWRQIYDEKPPRSIWQNLRHLLSLLAQLAFLSLLVLAVADPYLPWQLLQARRLVLVVDNSASMQATDVAPNRLQSAKAYALDVVSGLRERDEVAIVIAGQSPEVVVGMTGHVPTLRRAIESIATSDKSTHLTGAIELGKKLIGDHEHAQVLVLTDGCVAATEAEPATPEIGPESTVIYKIFGKPANNVGITQFQVRRSLIDPLGYEILASVLNASTQPARCRLEVTLDETPVDVVPLKLAPGELWKRAFEKTSIDGGILIGRLTQFESLESLDSPEQVGALEQPDASQSAAAKAGPMDGSSRQELVSGERQGEINQLLVDDQAWALLPQRSRQKVVLVSPGNMFLQKVFEASPLVDLSVSETLPESLPADALIVLHRNIPARIPDGNVFILDPATETNLWKVAGQISDPIITQQADDSPLMTHIRLDSVVVPSAVKLEFTVPAQVLAGTVNEAPIYASLRRDTGRCLVLLVNLDDSDLAFRTAFPILVTNALNWFANQSGKLNPSLATGALVDIELPNLAELLPTGASDEVVVESKLTGRASQSWLLQSPTGQRVPLALTEGTASYHAGPLDRVGIWELSRVGGEGEAVEPTGAWQRFAVNVASERETNLQPVEEFLDSDESAPWGGRWFTRPIWFYLAMLAGLFTGVEWFLYHRRFIS